MSEFIDELELIGDGKTYQYICGVDEAGRGPLCGPVAAAAVIMPKDSRIEGVNDSKKLTEKKREVLYEQIIKEAIAYHVCLIDNEEIDEINILNATLKAMETAINNLTVKADFALIDGNRNKGITTPNQMVVKGDSKSYSIACASILAKVTRDRLMEEYDKQYPEYGFLKHKGYGTKAHYEAIEQHGITPIHRKTFLKKILEK
ncbi:MAG: ribonuclease HII [Ruminococcaceae bacterium]|nr:ribonuclease HII [Oscillospiraceae bacterium]